MSRIRNYSVYVREAVAAADPFYRGPRAALETAHDDDITPIDPRKTERDLGRSVSPALEVRADLPPDWDTYHPRR